LNLRVRHDGTDLNDPFFDVYQDVQHQNDYATMQLNIMGNSGDVLKAQFLPEKIQERQDRMAPVRVAGTRDRQEALMTVNTAEKMFFVTGGQHMTEGDGWIMMEMVDKKIRVAALEKENKILLGNKSRTLWPSPSSIP
jgi:hypothetical protein